MSSVFDKGGDTQTTTTNTQPWYAQRPYLRSQFQRADDLYNDPTVGTVAPFTPDQNQSFDMVRQRALAGSPAQQAATNQIAATARGDFVGANPYLDAAFTRGADRIGTAYTNAVNGVTGNFSSGGRLGSGAYANARNNLDTTLGDAMSGFANDIYGGAYTTERENALRAASLGPSVAAGDYLDSNMLGQIGQQQQGQAQSILNNPYLRLAQYQGGVSGNYGGTTQQTVPVNSDPFGGLLGLATVAGGLGWQPFG